MVERTKTLSIPKKVIEDYLASYLYALTFAEDHENIEFVKFDLPEMVTFTVKFTREEVSET